MMDCVRRNIKQLGWLDCGLYALARLMARWTRGNWSLYKYYFVAQPVSSTILARGRGKNITVQHCLSARDLPPCYPRRSDVIELRYAQGAQSLAAFRNQQLAGFLWFQFDAFQEDEIRARYVLASRQSVWDFDVFVEPEERLGFVFSRLWDEAHQLLQAHAILWSCSRISAFNPASLSAHARIGSHAMASAIFLCCGRWQWMLASTAPFVHLSRHPASFPHLRFDTRHISPISNTTPRSQHAAS